MPLAHIHIESGPETIAAVSIGAILATVGGIIAGRIEARVARRERERTAALLFAEILAALTVIMRAACDARTVGEPYGRVTMRIIRAAYRETQTYDRNREELSALRDSQLRAKLHSVLVRLRMALESLVETDRGLRVLTVAEEGGAGPAASEFIADRDTAFNYALEVMQELDPVIQQLQRISKVKSDAYLAIRAAAPPSIRGA